MSFDVIKNGSSMMRLPPTSPFQTARSPPSEPIFLHRMPRRFSMQRANSFFWRNRRSHALGHALWSTTNWRL